MIGSQQFRFIVKKGPDPGHVYPVFAEKITIGRDPMSDIIFKDPEVSRRHVQFIRAVNGYLVEDLGSTNGTFVDGERLSGQQMPLKAGQEVALGGAITLIFEAQGNEAEWINIGTLKSDRHNDSSGHNNGSDDLDHLIDYEQAEIAAEPHLNHHPSASSLSDSSLRPAHNHQSSEKASVQALPAAANMRTFTNQQLIFLVLATVIATLVACGIFTLILYFIRANN